MRRLFYILLPALACMVFTFAAAGEAQVLPSLPPVRALGVPGMRTQGVFETAPLSVDGVELFRVAALASPPPGATPLDTRVLLVQNAISQVLAVDNDRGGTTFDPKEFRVAVERDGSEYVLVANDAHHTTPVPLLTITKQDAQLNGVTEGDLASQWQQAMQSALTAALLRRQPAVIRSNVTTVVRGAIALSLITLLGLTAYFWLRAKAHAVAEVLLWVIGLAWAIAITSTLLLFPQTVVFGQVVLTTALRIAMIALGGFVLDRFFGFAIDRATRLYASRSHGVERARRLLRAPTISRAINGFKSFIIFFVVMLGVLSALNIPIASVVTIGGIAALAIGFAAQSLVRDCLNGILVLIEDQYVVGDYVMIGNYNGIVESLSLRVVQIRDSLGNLITIPHSSVTQVANASRTWARIDYRVAVDPSVDLAKALATLREAVESLAQEKEWASSFVEPVESIGVEAMNKLGVVLRVQIRTAPLRQFELRRAVGARVHERFLADGIELGIDPLAPVAVAPGASPDPT